MDGNDTDAPVFRPRPADLWTAFGLLTRLPLPYPTYNSADPRPSAHAAWAYPLVGLAVGGIMALVGWVALAVSLPVAAAAGLTLLAGIVVTGALHEDGLADCADGFWGGWSVERRLEIMKDSQIGTYGVIALILMLGLKAAALTALMAEGGAVLALLAAQIASRAAMVFVMHLLPNARQHGLSHQTGRPPRAACWIAGGIGVAGLLMLGIDGLVVLILTALATIVAATIARRKINGQTGDVLGATQQVVDTTILLACAALAA